MSPVWLEELMNSTKLLIACAAIISLFVIVVLPQGDAKHFSKDGLVFDYANGWSITDQSNSDAQQLMLTRANSDAQIVVFVHRGKVESPDKFAQAKKAFIDPYVKSMSDRFVQMGTTPKSSSANSQIGGLASEGTRIRASLGSEGAEASIYWVNLENRVVMLTLFTPDAELKQVTPAWDMIRNSLKLEPPPAKASPTPKQKP
jgi:hypothetical protein